MSEPLLLTEEVPHSITETVEVPMEPMDIHGHTVWSKLAIGLWITLMNLSVILMTALITLVNVSYDFLIRIDCIGFWTFQPGTVRSSFIIPVFGILQYVFFVTMIYSAYRVLRTWLLGRVVATKVVRFDVTTVHQEKT